MQNLKEYLNIRNIIRRLQDIDKLKLVLLNENQNMLFDFIPKPGVGPKTLNRNVTVDMIHKRSISKREIAETLKKHNFNVDENDEVTKKILAMIDPEILSNSLV